MCYCPTPKLSPHRRLCISTFPQKNSLCMINKCLELWGHWKCPHKSPSHCNTGHTHVIIQICVLINHINIHTHTHIHTNHIVSLEAERTWYNIHFFHIWSEAIFSQFSYQWEEAAATGQDRLWVFPLVAMGENEIPQPSQKFYLHDQFSKWKLILLLSVILLLICAILFLITVNYFRRQHITQYYLWYSYFYRFLLFCLHFNFN